MGGRRIHVETGRTVVLSGSALISKLAWHWVRMGYRVTAGPVAEVGADVDLAILHVDLTRIEPGTVPANPAGVPFLNSRVLDISKRLLSTVRLERGDAWDGEVIVKSNLNFYGVGETKDRVPTVLERLQARLARRNWKLARRLPPCAYPVLPRVSAVPGWVWEDPELIVERFVPERDGDLYCMRGWVFFGSRGYTYRAFSPDPVVKGANLVRHEFLGEPPPELVAFREAHHWDFGKFDYVVVDGKPILLDANKTPSITTGPDTPRLRDLASGLEAVLESAG